MKITRSKMKILCHSSVIRKDIYKLEYFLNTGPAEAKKKVM